MFKFHKRILIAYLLICFVSSSKEAMIAYFNILRLGEHKKDYKLTSLVIKEFDLVGIAEVMNRNGIEKLVRTLNRFSGEEWDYHISPYAVGTDNYKEYFGYVWKKNKVEFIKSRGFYKEKKNEFIREPYGADFRIDNFDFTFIVVHNIHGNKSSLRRAEAFRMNDVYNYFQDLDDNEQDILMAGDFNLPSFDEGFEALYNNDDHIIDAISPTFKTTIGATGLVNSYDHFFVSLKHTKEFEGKAGVLDFTQGNYKEMKSKVSDHLPVFIIVNVDEDDD